MLQTFDLESVKSLAQALDARRAGCECHSEGLDCHYLDEAMACHLNVCKDVLANVRAWTDAVFRGRAEFNSEVEAIFKSQVQAAHEIGSRLVEIGVSDETECYEFTHLKQLLQVVNELERRLRTWVSPTLAVGPGPRVAIPQDAADEIRKTLAERN